ncbi:DUF2850 domain-containing protein [Vibrio tritonius]|uniref:DUF2850 domain-containing protein n=1 Tax=Vibrio tritonius TaxID=1435069 RepID=A0ABS7YMK6_9VIBR|nr:DUF2850 domain-containing protein [Vibrio tritonius]MCA2016920.1 DUF2850 domain-containing protein [Vibrio tritonius]
MASRKTKILEWSLLGVAVLGTLIAALMYGHLYLKAQLLFAPEMAIHGRWVEQNVPSYSAQTIEVKKNAISVQGHTVTTRYKFDGTFLSYRAGGINYKFKMTNDELTEMKLISPSYYSPVFRLSEKYKNNIR